MTDNKPKPIKHSYEQWALINELADLLGEQRGPRPSLPQAVEEAVTSMIKELKNAK